ncbi:glycosyltransferase family 4 protein [Nocardioides allogilvus]|uniref:glycosyltransferase family 4 protein n=1 Tax=Nocardioides allogilvus TaxID=2072017 RepID=UPI00130027E7|nr:glycosyltransferase family 4 protein [Nocardioides allogilvus]
MRLLYITASYPFGGSAESFLEPELAELAALGVRIDVLPMRRTGVARALPPGVTLRAESLAGSVRTTLRHRARGTGALLRVLRQSPRVLARNSVVIPLAVAVAASIADEEPYDHIHAHWLSHTSTCALAISHLTGSPFSITAHRWDVYVENLFHAKAERAVFIRFIARACRAAFEERVGEGAGRLVDLHMGVESSERVDGPPPLGQERGTTLRLVTAGSLLPVKGQRHLVEAMSLLRDRGFDTTLDLYGDGPLAPELAAQVSDLALADRVTMHGVRPRSELATTYAAGQYDVFVMPSVDLGGGVHEGVPVSVMEAMSAGLAVVATETGGIPELVVDGVTGLLVPDKSAAALADAIQRLSDDELRSTLAAAGTRHVRTEFDAATVAAQLLALMQG